MTAFPSCPAPEALRQFRLGLAPDEEVECVLLHLEQCGACVARLDAAPAEGDTLLEALHAPGTVPDAPAVPGPVSDLIDRLKGLYQSRAGLPVPETSPGCPSRIARYEVRGEVGAGGMGVVYRAFDPQLRRTVAVKVPRFDGPAEVRAEAHARFLREARAAARVRHPHVCSVYDAGEDGGRPYVVMDFIDGPSLAQRLTQGRYDDCRQAVELVRQIARALQAVHAHGIVHRDLKPGNILLDPAGGALLTDFGLASLPDGEHRTLEGVLVGTPAYLAPELIDPGRPASVASDVYGLGVVLYHMLTGHVPFEGPPLSLLRRIAAETPPPPAAFRPDLDPALEAVVLRAMARRPEDRFPDAAAFADALDRWLAEGHAGAGVTVRQEKPSGSGRKGWLPGHLLSLAVVLGCLAAGAGWYFSTHSAAGPAPVVPPSPLAPAAPVLGGWIDLRISEPGNPDRNGIWLRDAGALPLKARDRVRVSAGVNRPAFLYLLLIDTTGRVTPLYPGKPGRWQRPADESRRDRLDLPEETTAEGAVGGWEVEGPPGMETLVLLARATPLPREVSLEKLVAGLPRQTRTGRHLALRFENGNLLRPGTDRGFKCLDPSALDDPVLQTQALLYRRLKTHFDGVYAVSYANQAE